MLIGSGGYSSVWHPPRKDNVIEKKYRGNPTYIQRYTTEPFGDISKGQYARSVFDPEGKKSSPLIIVYERPNNSYSEIRLHREDSLSRLHIQNINKNNIKLFCKFMQEMEGLMEGLVVLHKMGWVHHDIKPPNILYDKKPAFKLYLIDWGTAVRSTEVYNDTYRPWFIADNSNHPPEYKIYAHYKNGYQYKGGSIETDYANSTQLFTLLKIQPEYMSMLKHANERLQSLFQKGGQRFLKRIAPKTDVFALGLVIAQTYLILAYTTYYGTNFHTEMIRLIRYMIRPNPLKRWSMKRSLQKFIPLVQSACSS